MDAHHHLTKLELIAVNETAELTRAASVTTDTTKTCSSRSPVKPARCAKRSSRSRCVSTVRLDPHSKVEHQRRRPTVRHSAPSAPGGLNGLTSVGQQQDIRRAIDKALKSA